MEGAPPPNSAVNAGSLARSAHALARQRAEGEPKAATVLISIQAASERPMAKVLTDKLRTNIHRACDSVAQCALQVAAVAAFEAVICSKAWKTHLLDPSQD
jgi:hypothetical protein